MCWAVWHCTLKSLKLQRENCQESRQILKCSVHPVAPGWSNRWWNWVTAEIQRLSLSGLNTVFSAALQIPTNSDGTWVQITAQADVVQSEWCSSPGSWLHLPTRELLFRSSRKAFVKMKSQPKCGFWRKDVWGCIYMCMLSVCARTEADLRNGPRPGHLSACKAWGPGTSFWH